MATLESYDEIVMFGRVLAYVWRYDEDIVTPLFDYFDAPYKWQPEYDKWRELGGTLDTTVLSAFEDWTTPDEDDDRERCSEGCDNYRDDDGGKCVECRDRDMAWGREWNRYSRREVANRYTEADIEDCYSDATETAKRTAMLKEVER